jgi:hypothetical protein
VIIRAESVAMSDEHSLAIQLDHDRVGNEAGPRLVAELPAEQEIPVAVDNKAGNAAVRELAQRADDAGFLRVGIVVAHPDFEEIPEDVERFGAGDVRAQEGEELFRGVGCARVQMHV